MTKDEYPLTAKLDMCITDAITKATAGVLIGTALSMTVLRRKRWPVTCGLGFGSGLAWRNCEYDINSIKKTI